MNIEQQIRKAQAKINALHARIIRESERRAVIQRKLDDLTNWIGHGRSQVIFQRGMIAAFEIMAQQQKGEKK